MSHLTSESGGERRWRSAQAFSKRPFQDGDDHVDVAGLVGRLLRKRADQDECLEIRMFSDTLGDMSDQRPLPQTPCLLVTRPLMEACHTPMIRRVALLPAERTLPAGSAARR